MHLWAFLLSLLIITGVPNVTFWRITYAIFQQLLSLITPVIMVALIFCIPLKILLNRFIIKMRERRQKTPSLLISINEERFENKRVAIYLLLILIFGVTVAFIPHLQSVNPNNERVGVDSLYYVRWFTQMSNQSGSPIVFALKDLNRGRSPSYNDCALWYFAGQHDNPLNVIEYSPLVLTPLLIIIMFFLAREITSNDKICILASFLTAISFQTLVGIYSGSYAGWLALSLGYLALILLVKCLKSPSKSKLITLTIAMVGVYSHSCLHMDCYDYYCICILIYVYNYCITIQRNAYFCYFLFFHRQ